MSNVVVQIRSAENTPLRNIALLSAFGLIDFIPISLYQLGVIRHLPDLKPAIFDSDQVNGSEEAQVLGLPDGPVSLVLYAATLALSGGLLKNGRSSKLFKYLLTANLVGQALGGAYYLYNMVKVQKKICLYCVTGALINFASLIPLKKILTTPQQ